MNGKDMAGLFNQHAIPRMLKWIEELDPQRPKIEAFEQFGGRWQESGTLRVTLEFTPDRYDHIDTLGVWDPDVIKNIISGARTYAAHDWRPMDSDELKGAYGELAKAAEHVRHLMAEREQEPGIHGRTPPLCCEKCGREY